MITEAKNKLMKKKPKNRKRYQTHKNEKPGLSFLEVTGYKKG